MIGSGDPAMDTSATERAPLSTTDFATFGINLVAYIKPVTVNGAAGFAIHAADGRHLADVPGRDAAIATVRRHEMEPVSVH